LGEIFIIDGEDTSIIHQLDYTNILYFKRELLSANGIGNTYTHIYPICYCIPKEKFQEKTYFKESLDIVDDYKPHCVYLNAVPKSYNINTEEEYYKRYNNTGFVLTGRKGGYDALRHYEIIAAHSVPIYIDWDKVPRTCMCLWPSLLQLEANTLYIDYKFYNRYTDEQFEKRYFKLLDKFYDYGYNNLTTEKMAEYLLSFV